MALATTGYNHYKLYRVRRGARTTTVSLDPALVIRAGKKLGLDRVQALVLEAAAEFTAQLGVSCSGYVASQLESAMEGMPRPQA
jgi:hypothetical protein